MPYFSREKREEAKERFVSGISMREISETMGIKYSTLKTWREKDDWGSLRKKARAKADEAILARVTKKVVKNTEFHIDASSLFSNLIVREGKELIGPLDEETLKKKAGRGSALFLHKGNPGDGEHAENRRSLSA